MVLLCCGQFGLGVEIQFAFGEKKGTRLEWAGLAGLCGQAQARLALPVHITEQTSIDINHHKHVAPLARPKALEMPPQPPLPVYRLQVRLDTAEYEFIEKDLILSDLLQSRYLPNKNIYLWQQPKQSRQGTKTQLQS